MSEQINQLEATGAISVAINVRQRQPLEMFIRILLQGGRVIYKGDTWAMDIDGHLCVVRSNMTTHEEVLLEVDCDLSAAKKMADTIGSTELWLQACAMQL